MSYAGPANPARRQPSLRPVTGVGPSQIDRNLAFAAGLAVGLAAGAGLALLLAPHSGRGTRRKIVRSGQRLTQSGRDVWHDLGREFRRQLRSVRRARETRRAEIRSGQDTPAGQRRSFSFRAASSL